MSEEDISDREALNRFTLIWFLLKHCAVGAIAGWTLLGGMLWFDVGGLGTLVSNSPEGVFAVGLMAFFFLITFGTVAMGGAVMTMHRRKPPSGGKRRPVHKQPAYGVIPSRQG